MDADSTMEHVEALMKVAVGAAMWHVSDCLQHAAAHLGVERDDSRLRIILRELASRIEKEVDARLDELKPSS